MQRNAVAELLGGTSMHRVRRNGRYWRDRWPWNWFVVAKINERFCRKCGLPFQEGTPPEPVLRASAGNVCVEMFPSGGFRSNDYVVTVGRCRAGGKGLYLSEFIPFSEVLDVFRALENLQEEWRIRQCDTPRLHSIQGRKRG